LQISVTTLARIFVRRRVITVQREHRYQTGDQALVRQINLSVILNHLRENAPISRAVLADMTGLNKTTVSSLVTELIERQFVHEIGLESTHSGRSAGRLGMLLTLNPAAGCIVSAEIGVDFISVICTNFAPEVIWQHEETIDPEKGQGEIIQRTLALLNLGVAAGMKSCHTLLGIAVGVPGLVDLKSGTLLFAPNLKWQDTPLHDLLQDRFDAPLVVANEASMAALGEHYFGAARGYDEVLYISAGVGLGGGIVNHGRVYNGVSGFGGEFGHMTMDPGGELCNCGNRGCWETLVSQRALYRYVQEEIQQGYPSLLPQLAGESFNRLSVAMIANAAEAGDVAALRALDRLGGYLGIGIASLVNALNPELVVFGGILSLAGQHLLRIVNQALERRALRWNREATRVVLAHHGSNACVMGGVAAIYQSVLAKPIGMGSPTDWVYSQVVKYPSAG
jgi:glucokinase-like ROK family protein